MIQVWYFVNTAQGVPQGLRGLFPHSFAGHSLVGCSLGMQTEACSFPRMALHTTGCITFLTSQLWLHSHSSPRHFSSGESLWVHLCRRPLLSFPAFPLNWMLPWLCNSCVLCACKTSTTWAHQSVLQAWAVLECIWTMAAARLFH